MRLSGVVLVCAASVLAQDGPLPRDSVTFNLPKDSPVTVLKYGSDQSRAVARGAAVVLDLHMSVVLRNDSPGRIRGVTLRVVSQEVAMGGKGSVTVPSLNIRQGESFPVRIDMQLVRPVQQAGGPLVQVDLDGVLFEDFTFYGPDRLNSRRYMTACEMEARRDREYFRRVLAQAGKEGLRQQILESSARQQELQPLSVKVRRGPSVTSAAMPSERMAQFAFLEFPDSPVQPVQGWAQISGNEARAPQIEIRNRSAKPVKYVEVGWLVSDRGGREYLAASLPSSEPNLLLPPGRSARVLQDSTLNFTSNGQPVAIGKMTGFINQVEFTDGKVWVPNRQSLGNPVLRKTLAPSAEEQRLCDLYRHKGIDALIEELKKF